MTGIYPTVLTTSELDLLILLVLLDLLVLLVLLFLYLFVFEAGEVMTRLHYGCVSI